MEQEGRSLEQDRIGCQEPAGPLLCANNCGRLCSEATLNFCSKCYQEALLCNTNAFLAASTGEEPLSSSSEDEKRGIVTAYKGQISLCVGNSCSASSALPERQQKQQNAKISNRCLTCKKRVGLTGIRCRCGDLFCAFHRYSDRHNCSFDYKIAAQNAIAKANPMIKAVKIEKL